MGGLLLWGKCFQTINGSSALAIVISLPPPTCWHDSNIKIEISLGCFSEAIIKFTNYSTVTDIKR